MTTELEVIDAAIEQLSKRGGYTNSQYQADRKGRPCDPGPTVAATCAVGGVEQAIWKLTGKDPGHRIIRPDRHQRSLYARVMRLLNRKAKKMFGNEDIEDVTFGESARITRPKVLAVFESVREDLTS